MHCLYHAGKLIEKNGGFGLFQKSESPLEAMHKVIRKTGSFGARTLNLSGFLTDIVNKMYLNWSPLIKSQKPKKPEKKARDTFKYLDDFLVASFLFD